MTELGELPPEINKTEIGKNPYSGIHFEPGIHPLTEKGIAQVGADFSAGNLEAHLWNEQVLKRIKRYSPQVMAIDGQGPSYEQSDQVRNGEFLWISLPGRPSEINPQGEIFIIRGDILERETFFEESGEKIIGLKMEDSRVNEDAFQKFASAGENLAFLLLTMYGMPKIIENRLSPGKKMTRRHFLRLATGVATTAAWIGRLTCIFPDLAP